MSGRIVDEYHADFEHIGHTMMEHYDESPARYDLIYVQRAIDPPPPTPPMLLGSVTHTLMLQPSLFDTLYLVAKGCGARRGKAWEAADAEAWTSGRTAILPDMLEAARGMSEALKANAEVMQFLESEGPVEKAIRWTDPLSGLKCKCRPDKLVTDPRYPFRVCCDIKSTADPRKGPFSKQAANFGYHRQIAHYIEGCRWQDEDEPNYVGLYFAVGNTPPYDVYIHKAPEVMLDRGAQQNREILERIAECHKTGIWLAPEQRQICELEWPRWA